MIDINKLNILSLRLVSLFQWQVCHSCFSYLNKAVYSVYLRDFSKLYISLKIYEEYNLY